jgi:hypothetical protein
VLIYVIVRYYAFPLGGVNHISPSDLAYFNEEDALAACGQLNDGWGQPGENRGPYGVMALNLVERGR